MRNIKLTRKSQHQIDDITEYLENKWNENIRKKFIQQLDESIQLIQKNPKLFPEIQNGLHKCVVRKQVSVFYSLFKIE